MSFLLLLLLHQDPGCDVGELARLDESGEYAAALVRLEDLLTRCPGSVTDSDAMRERLNRLTGRVVLHRANPGAATVLVDGKAPSQLTDGTLVIAAGRHTVTVESDACEAFVWTGVVRPVSTEELEVRPTCRARPGTVDLTLGRSLMNAPRDATVSVDGKTQELSGFTLSLVLEPGPHELEVRRRGRPLFRERVEIKSDDHLERVIAVGPMAQPTTYLLGLTAIAMPAGTAFAAGGGAYFEYLDHLKGLRETRNIGLYLRFGVNFGGLTNGEPWGGIDIVAGPVDVFQPLVNTPGMRLSLQPFVGRFGVVFALGDQFTYQKAITFGLAAAVLAADVGVTHFEVALLPFGLTVQRDTWSYHAQLRVDVGWSLAGN